MSNEKFTPGEWVISTEDDDCFIVRDKDGGFVCYGGCFDPDNKSEVEDAKRDITLIAAAPNMYRMLEQLHGALQSYNAYGISRCTAAECKYEAVEEQE